MVEELRDVVVRVGVGVLAAVRVRVGELVGEGREPIEGAVGERVGADRRQHLVRRPARSGRTRSRDRVPCAGTGPSRRGCGPRRRRHGPGPPCRRSGRGRRRGARRAPARRSPRAPPRARSAELVADGRGMTGRMRTGLLPRRACPEGSAGMLCPGSGPISRFLLRVYVPAQARRHLARLARPRRRGRGPGSHRDRESRGCCGASTSRSGSRTSTSATTSSSSTPPSST